MNEIDVMIAAPASWMTKPLSSSTSSMHGAIIENPPADSAASRRLLPSRSGSLVPGIRIVSTRIPV